jgi:hypothetical protein
MSEPNTDSRAAGSGRTDGRRAPVLSRRKRIGFALVIVALLVLFAEGSLQLSYRISNGSWLWEWWTVPIYAADPVRVYRVKANLDYQQKTSEFSARYLTDSAGMRTDGHQPVPAIPKPPGTFRILALGPSFAFGWGVNYEDAYLYRIANGLKVPGKRVELVNLGTPSQPICYQLKWLRETGYVYQPDLILQTVYGQLERIDSDDVLPDDRPVVRNGYLYPSGKMTLAMRVRWLRKYSATLFYGWYLYRALVHPDPTAGSGTELYKKSEPAGDFIVADSVRSYRKYIEFVHAAVTNRPQVVFLQVPWSWVVRPADISRASITGRGLNPYKVRERSAQICSALTSNGLNFIDTTPRLVQHDQETRMYNLYDIHFTVAGNKVVADDALPIIQAIVTRTNSIER